MLASGHGKCSQVPYNCILCRNNLVLNRRLPAYIYSTYCQENVIVHGARDVFVQDESQSLRRSMKGERGL